MITQLSIFAANEQGAMHRMTGLLADADIDIDTMVTNDSAEFGIVRMVVSDTDKAKKVMEDAGYLCRIDKVIAITMENKKGSLKRILDALDQSNINLDYFYVSWDRSNALPIAIIHAPGATEVEESLMSRGFAVRGEE